MEYRQLNPDLILNAYARGLFPMADSADNDEIYWYDPEWRGQLSLTHLHVPRRLRRTLRQNPYRILFNRDFHGVIRACAAPGIGRQETWINTPIREAFIALHHAGFAHSVEAWKNDRLVGGLYGLALGGAFFGESMFSAATDASKICLVHLAAHLHGQGFTLLDTQFINEHLKQFGVYELPRDEYHVRLKAALARPVRFIPEKRHQSSKINSSSSAPSATGGAGSWPSSASFESSADSLGAFLQSMTQMS